MDVEHTECMRTGPTRATRSGTSGIPPLPYMVVVACLMHLVVAAPLAAYIDPITGSIIFQLIAAVVLGAALTVKRVWSVVTGTLEKARTLVSGLWSR
jgi:hypothetical protein